LQRDADGSIQAAVSNCEGEGYEGEIVAAEIAVASVDDYVAGGATFWTVEGSSGSVIAPLPRQAVDAIGKEHHEEDRFVVALEFSLLHESGDTVSHTVTLQLNDARAGLISQQDDDSPYCLWANAPPTS
jgi:hypothetical protein